MSFRSVRHLEGFVLFIPIASRNGQPEAAHDWTPFGATIAGRPALGLSLFVFMINSNNVIKGRIAEDIVSEMLREAGYFIYRFGYEGVLQSLIQEGLPKMRKDSVVAQKIRTMPDFIVMDRAGNVFFVEVKYRHSGENDRSFTDWLKRAVRYWPEAKLLLIHPYEPNFQISTIFDYVKSGKLYPLERDRFLRVDKELAVHYAKLIKKYLI